MVVTISCTFEINSKRQVGGVINLESGPDGDFIRLECPVEFAEALVLKLEPYQKFELGEFLNDSGILFWKVTILPGNNNMDTIVILSLAREPELTLHLSIEAGVQSRHFETSLSEAISDLEAFFTEGEEDLP